MAYAIFGFLSGVGYPLLVFGNLRWQLVVGSLFGATLWLWLGANLLHLRHWALVLGRVLAVLAVIGMILIVVFRRVRWDPAVVVLSLGQLALALAVIISLFSPGVTRAFKQRPVPTVPEVTPSLFGTATRAAARDHKTTP
jgi:hypothetical protein